VRAARSAAIASGLILLWSFNVSSTKALAGPAVGDVLLSDAGASFTLVSEVPGNADSLTRTFENEHAHLLLNAFPVTDPPGVRQMFQLFSNSNADFTVVPEPSMALAAWFVPAGLELGQGFASLIFAARDYMFVFTLGIDAASDIEPVSFVRALADRQLAAGGGLPPVDESVGGERTPADDALIPLLPAQPPAEYAMTSSATVVGPDELKGTDGVQGKVADFLNKNSATATRVWSNDAGDLLAAVSITKYPYDIFAASALGEAAHPSAADVVSTDALDDVPNVVAYTGRGTASDQIGTAFRRGDVFVLVLVTHGDGVAVERAAELAADLTRLTASGLPSGGTGPYQFPGTPSKLLGLALAAAVVTAAAGGSTAVGRLRARRVSKRWSGSPLPPPEPVMQGARSGTATPLDLDARRLRRRGAIVLAGQLAAVNICIVSLSGDFAWSGAGVAALALTLGLLLTHWWQRRELGLLGAAAPSRQFVMPRPLGAVVGVLALAVLALGVGFATKGLRYVVLPISLAQLKWSDLLGIAPRTVGFVFGIGGFLTTLIGAWLFRVARALSRSGTKRVLEVDHRQAALYLRSFDDDSVPLPAIASARRPLLELFSLRGTDPFEESVAWELNSYGPVVAVGRPGRSLASLGAAREHLSDDTWKDQVASRMEEAGIIAVATGQTDGLAWELGHIVSGGHMSKTFFVFPPVAPAEIGLRWEHTVASLVDAGHAVGSLPVSPALIHTVRIEEDGTTKVTFANRRDEATYRTAVDHALEPATPAIPAIPTVSTPT
jgi:hypothetical protein